MKKYLKGAITGMGFGFPTTLACMILIGGWNAVTKEFLVWMVASALYGLLSVALFYHKNSLPLPAMFALHFLGVSAITTAAVFLNGYVSSFVELLPILLIAFVIYVIISLICYFINKQEERAINRALEEK